ncbi:hypothetical protein BLNAU_21080 [Blattamonas nauphoetae]|uniref:Protein kinase domain-containing protein n=1 Tax=Blattamonas nauphoetae TaxID=2049346 RepID=A0ABQ9X031_9EUKA|nr:hypothetical protein BLNAU_21080 [Blattamonas nauphoetae]
MVRMFDSEACQQMSTFSLVGVTHLSKTCTLPPLVGILRPPTIITSAPNSEYFDSTLDASTGVSVVGVGLVFSSTSFSAGTGPLFSFSLTEESLLADTTHSLRMETTLMGSSFLNVTSRRVETRKEQLFGGEVNQRVVGCSIGQSTNHNSGTAMMDVNMGGNVRCMNTSFCKCRREGNTNPSFINENVTQTTIGRQIIPSSSTITLVSYSLCTFKDMTVSKWTVDGGGAAVHINKSSSSLAVLDCFFENCTCTDSHDDGGAICMWGKSASGQFFRLERSSFSKCETKVVDQNFAGCVLVVNTPSVTIHDCFFEKSTAFYDGALTLYTGTHSILFNCAFVLCSAQNYSGAVGIHFTATFEFLFVQFRECQSTAIPNGRDVFFRDILASQITSDMFKFCDSTSGSPNIYFQKGSTSNSNFIPQISKGSTPTISLTINFDELQELATVTVTASEAIEGTMGILLDGLIVPRVVHVTFGSIDKKSQTGIEVVSSGRNGVLPKAQYSLLNYSHSSSLFPPKLFGCVCSSQDSDTIILVVDGWRFEEGNYVMFVKTGVNSEEMEVALNRLDKYTLRGTAPLYPSTAEGRLDWDTEYEVTKVVMKTADNIETIVPLQSVKFTTPKEPIRIEGANCSLGGEKEKAGVVEFWGVGLSSGKGYTLKVQKESSEGVLSGEDIELVGTLTPSPGSESGSFSHTEEIFGVSPALLSYGSRYQVVGIVVGGVEGVVNKKVGFSVPGEPSRLTKMTGSDFTDAEKTRIELSFETHALSASTAFEMILQSIVGEGETGHEKTLNHLLRIDSDPQKPVLYPREEDETKRKGQLEFGTRYEVKRIQEGSTAIHFEATATTFSTPDEPTRIEACVNRLLNKDRTQLTLVLTGRLLTSTKLSICLDNGSNTWTPLSPITVENDTHCSVEFQVGKDENTSTLAFGKKYTLQRDGESTHFVVHGGIVVSVPNPPSLQEIRFSFANDLNTSCVVEVAGNDLVASTEYNVTLNSSLWVIVRFSSSTKGKSGETQIGWEGGLQFDAEYTVTSLVPLNVEDGDILLLESVSGETGKRPSSFNIFTDSSSLEGSPFCGDLSRACSSISEVWKIISGLVIVRPTIEIVDSVRMNDGIRIVGGMHVVIRNGTSSEPSLIIPSSFSLDSLSAVIVVEATGFLELRNVDVWIESSDPSFVFISATQATIILREGIITGPKSSPTRNEEASEDVCSWTSGILQLTNCATSVSHQDMLCLAQGFLNMKGGSVSLVSSLFSDNSPNLEPFPSFRRNLICSESGSIDVRSPRGGDGTTESPSAWIITDGCSMEGDGLKLVSPFFIPTLSNTSTSSFDKKEALYEIEMEGSTLIPCGLFLEVFEMTKDKQEGTLSRHSLNRNTTNSFTETSIKLTLPSSSLSSLKPELEWRGRLVFGADRRTDTTFIIQPNRIEKLSQSIKDNMKWWLPLVIVVAVALLVVILLIVMCVWRRKKNGRKEDKEPLMLTQEMEVEKYEEVEEDPNAPTAHVSSVRGLNGNTLNVGHWTENERSETRKIAEEKEEREIPFENRVCGLSCGEKDGVVEVVDKTETLYRRLHVSKLGVDRRWAQLSVARGLSRAMKMSHYSAILTELTSHSVVLSGERTMHLILKSDTTQPDPLTEQPTQPNEDLDENRNEDEPVETPLNLSVHETDQKPAHPQPPQIVRPHPLRQSEVHRDDVRWQAPEEEEGREEGRKTNEGEVRNEIDRTKASVFRLGLVLWEIETGLVPFAEQDGVNAHRNLSIGIMPPMEGIGEKMKELIEECLSVNPADRPSIDSIISRLSSMDGKASAQKAQHIALS